MDKQILEQYIDACELIKDTKEEIRKLRKRRSQIQQDSVKEMCIRDRYRAEGKK